MSPGESIRKSLSSKLLGDVGRFEKLERKWREADEEGSGFLDRDTFVDVVYIMVRGGGEREQAAVPSDVLWSDVLYMRHLCPSDVRLYYVLCACASAAPEVPAVVVGDVVAVRAAQRQEQEGGLQGVQGSAIRGLLRRYVSRGQRAEGRGVLASAIVGSRRGL